MTKKQKLVEYHDNRDAPAHKEALAAGAKYGNDVALWPKDLADKEYTTRKRMGTPGSKYNPKLGGAKKATPSAKKRTAAKKRQ